MQSWHMYQDLSGRCPIDYALTYKTLPKKNIGKLLEYLISNPDVQSHKHIMQSLFPRLLELEVFNGYLARALEDQNQIENSLLINFVKCESPIYSYDPLRKYNVDETYLIHPDVSFCYDIKQELNLYKGDKPELLEFVYLDFRHMFVHHKINQVRYSVEGDHEHPRGSVCDINLTNDNELCEFISTLYQNFGDKIETQMNFRLVIDTLYDRYYPLVRIELMVQLFLYTLPFCIQIFDSDRSKQIVFLNIALLGQIIMTIKELNALRLQGAKSYFDGVQNYIDFGNFALFYLYYILRMS